MNRRWGGRLWRTMEFQLVETWCMVRSNEKGIPLFQKWVLSSHSLTQLVFISLLSGLLLAWLSSSLKPWCFLYRSLLTTWQICLSTRIEVPLKAGAVGFLLMHAENSACRVAALPTLSTLSRPGQLTLQPQTQDMSYTWRSGCLDLGWHASKNWVPNSWSGEALGKQ